MVNSIILLTLAASACVQAGVVQQRQLKWTGPGGKVADPPNAAPRKQVLKSSMNIPGVQTIKIRYGPYSVPNMGTKNLQSGEYGALSNFPDLTAQKPCEECTIVKMEAGLEYPNGTDANIDSGMWLHHMVGINQGPGRWDATCVNNPRSIPHYVVGATAKNSERFLSSGNERMPLVLAPSDRKAGYHLRKTDSFKFLVDLMNMNMDDRIVYLTMSYDIVDGALPTGWSDIKTIWLDADNCASSDVDPPQEKGAFTITSKPWIPNFEGEVLSLGGHLHDGGSSLEVVASNTSSVCTSQAKYGESDKYIFKDSKTAAMMGGDQVAEKHISTMTWCGHSASPVKVTTLNKNQSWQLKGNYDYDRFEGNKNRKGLQDHIMAISIVFAAVSPDLVTKGI